MEEKEFEIQVNNIGSDGTTKQVCVTGHGITLKNYWFYYTLFTNWKIRRWVKSAKKTIRNMVDLDA